MKTGFVTCVQLGLDCMEAIYSVGGRLDLVLTLRDNLAVNKSGRIFVDEFCRDHDIEVFKLRNINEDAAVAKLRAANLDWLFIIGWSQIAGPGALDSPKYGVLGIHPTLLPKGRGRAAIPWAILKGLRKTGVTLFKLDEGVDTGPIVEQIELPIADDETATSLYERVCKAHQTLIRKVCPRLLEGSIIMTPQDESMATEWPGRCPEDGLILPTMSVDEVDRLVRATTRPYPGAFLVEPDRIVRVWSGRTIRGESKTTEGAFQIQFTDGVFEAHDYQFDTDAVKVP